MNPIRIPHGGVHAVFLDTVMRYAGFFTGDANAQLYRETLNLNVSLLAKSRVKYFIVVGRRIGGRRRIFLLKDMSRTIQGSC